MTGVVYILKSLKNNTYYIGSTTDLGRRLSEHLSGRSTYTKEILPVELVFSQEYPTTKQTIKIEYWLKKQKDKNFIERIVNEGKITKDVVQ